MPDRGSALRRRPPRFTFFAANDELRGCAPSTENRRSAREEQHREDKKALEDVLARIAPADKVQQSIQQDEEEGTAPHTPWHGASASDEGAPDHHHGDRVEQVVVA